MATGVEKGKLQMEAYNPAWAEEGKNMVETLWKYMPEAVDIKHIGSTAIVGMMSKPIIDIAVLVDSLDVAETWVEPLKELGFFYAGAVFEGGREFGRDNPETGNREVHIHVVPEDNTRWDGYVDIVDYCNAFPEERDAYAALKRELLAKYADEPQKYGPAKSEFMIALEARAFAWRRRNAYILMRLKNLAEDYPDRIAVCDTYGEDGRFRKTSYSQLYELAGRTASKLKAMGVKRGTPVIVRMERRVEYIAAVYGVLMARGVVIPAIPSYPDSRIEDMMNDSGAVFELTEEFYEDVYKYEPSQAVHINDKEIVWMNYTSGSTGKPKGVEYAYKSVDTGIALAGTELFNGMDELNHASTVSMSFAAAAFDVYSLLYLGGVLHIIPEDARKDPALISKYIDEHDVTSVTISPGMIRFFKAPESLKRLLTIGQRVINAYSEKYETLAAYGTTECFTACLAFKVDKNYENTPVGKRIGLFEADVVDEAGNSLPENQEGEIAIYGYTAEGYRGLEEATQKAFIDIGGGKHCHLTGDIGYKDENGVIVLLNRKDWMVKISGQRVDPAEAERAIRAVDGVGDCVVKAFYKESGDAFLCAYYTADKEIPREKLLSIVEKELPPYMSPAYTVRMDSFPLTASGKFDHAKLKDPRKLYVNENYEAPITDTEKKVCKAMESVLGLSMVGRNDDFYENGGDSIQTLALINEIGDITILAKDIVKARTAAKIAEVIDNNAKEYSGYELTKEQHDKIRAESMELYPLQNHYYRYKKMLPDAAIGNTPILVEWDKSKYSAEELAKAADTVINCFDVFSSRVVEDENGAAYLKIVDSKHEKTDVLMLSDEDFDKHKNSLIKPFDVLNGEMYRMKVYCTESRLLLFVDMHHIICDEGAQNILMYYIQEALEGNKLPKDYYYPILKYAKHIKKIKKLPDGYATLPSFDNEPKACTRGGIPVMSGISLKKLTELVRNIGISVSEYVVACATKALSEYNSNDKVIAECMSGNRVSSLTQSIVGMMVSTDPLEIEISKDEPFLDYVNRVAANYRSITHDNHINAYNWERPMYDDIININYIPYYESRNRNWKKIDLIEENKYVMNAMYVVAMEQGEDEELRFLFVYNSTAYERSSVEKFAQIFMKNFNYIKSKGYK